LLRSLQWMDFYQIWYRRSARGRNQLCRIFCRSVQEYWFCGGGLKFAYPHRNWRSPLTLCELPFRLWCTSASMFVFLFVPPTPHPPRSPIPLCCKISSKWKSDDHTFSGRHYAEIIEESQFFWCCLGQTPPILVLKVVSGKLLAVRGIMTAHWDWLP